jgi:hypothetical protein
LGGDQRRNLDGENLIVSGWGTTEKGYNREQTHFIYGSKRSCKIEQNVCYLSYGMTKAELITYFLVEHSFRGSLFVGGTSSFP